MNLEKLKDPIPYKYRLQSAKGHKATIVSYVDSRQVQDHLDNVVGIGNWQDQYAVIDGNLYCGISINVGADTGQDKWITKWDVGTESSAEKEKGNSSDSFKRAAVKWGIGRFLYSLGMITLKTASYKDKEYPADDEGNILWGVDALTEYCKKVSESGNLDRTARNVPPLNGAKKPEQPKVTPPKPPVKKEEKLDDRKTAALTAFKAIDFSKVISVLVKDYKLTYTKLEDFIAGETIERILEVYAKVK